MRWGARTYQSQFSAVYQGLQAHAILVRLCAQYKGTELLVLLLVISSLDAALQDIGKGGPSGGKVVKDLGLFLKDDVKVPASTERTDGRFNAEAASGNDLDLDRTVGALWVGGGNTGSVELLVRRLYHFVLGRGLVVSSETSVGYTYLLREVDPEL